MNAGSGHRRHPCRDTEHRSLLGSAPTFVQSLCQEQGHERQSTIAGAGLNVELCSAS
jgi:hypothetical protein